MAHEKVYGMYDNKCRVEVLSKDEALVINKSIVDTEMHVNVGYPIPVPKNGEKRIYSGGLDNPYLCNGLSEYPDNYYGLVVIKVRGIARTPMEFLKINNVPNVKFLNGSLDTSSFTVLNYHFYHDGINLCIWCAGYA